MDTYIILLWPQGSHLGPLTAQTLFGGVCWALDTLGMVDVGRMLAGFEEQPRFAISSPFPFVRKPDALAKKQPELMPGDLIRLYPKPHLRPVTIDRVQQMTQRQSGASDGLRFKQSVKRILDEQVKRVQKTSWVSEGLFAQICEGQWDEAALVDGIGDKIEKAHGALWLSGEHRAIKKYNNQKSDLWGKADVQRNAVDRVAGATAEGLLFHESQFFYHRGLAGLWFVARADAKAWGWLEAAFRYLQDTGLGGKRTVGKGHFTFRWFKSDTALPQVKNPDAFINLSPYVPVIADGTIQTPPLRYTLQTVRQKVENRMPGKQQMQIYSGGARLFGEGATFRFDEQLSVYGRLVKLREIEGRQVYYNGLTLPVFARLGGE